MTRFEAREWAKSSHWLVAFVIVLFIISPILFLLESSAVATTLGVLSVLFLLTYGGYRAVKGFGALVRENH